VVRAVVRIDVAGVRPRVDPDRVVAGIVAAVGRFKPGCRRIRPRRWVLVSQAYLGKVERLIAAGREDGATLACGARPREPHLARGHSCR
jgi:hypothetical protein